MKTRTLKYCIFFSMLIPSVCAGNSREKLLKMKTEFADPPSEARPRVWWHWEDGNITRDGIRKDLEWMHRIGIGGYHHFDAGMAQKPVVKSRMVYMHEDWRDAFRYAIELSDSLGMSVGIASSPGWSNTGGPWVKEEDAMKRLVWSSVDTGCGTFNAKLQKPFSLRGWYRDIKVIAMKLPESGDGYRSIKVLSPDKRQNWNVHPYRTGMALECSDNGVDFRLVTMIPPTSAPSITVNFSPVKAEFFRVRKADGKILPEDAYILFRNTRVEHAEEKAGFSSPYDLSSFKTVLPEGEKTASSAAVVDISSFMAPDGTLVWDVPDGKWRIIRFGYTLTGKRNGPAPKEATGLEVDKFDKTAYRNYFLKYLDMYKDATGGMIGKRGINELLVDSYEAWWQTWTPSMMEEFERKRGYSMLPWMPVLTGDLLDSAEASEKFLFDWRRTISDLYFENYAQVKDIAAEYGIGTVCLESQENGRVFVADGMDIKRNATVPMAACWCVVSENPSHSTIPVAVADMRESASVAHIYGRQWVAAESFTVDGLLGKALWFTPQRLKRLADTEFASGVNRIFIHESSHQPLDDCRPGLGLIKYGQWFSRHETWAELARPWTDYLARTSYMLSRGRNVADILVYYGEDTNVTAKYGRTFFPVPAGYNYDFINARGLADLKVSDGLIVAPSGAVYRLLCLDIDGLPQSEDAAQSLQNLISAGAKVCGVGELAAEVQSIRKDVDSAPELRFVHRRTDDSDIYWIDNPTDKIVVSDVSLRCFRGVPMRWDPEDGTVRSLDYRKESGHIVVPVEMLPDEAFFIVCSSGKGVEKRMKCEVRGMRGKSPAQTMELKGWTLRFPERTFEVDALRDYASFRDEYVKYFSGTCIYSTEVTLDRTPSSAVLDMGRVCDLCELKVNGEDMGILWHSPFRKDIGSVLHKGSNTIEIKVVNTWVNRLIGDAQPNCPKVTTYTSRKFYGADSPLQPAGLLGPVQLRFVE